MNGCFNCSHQNSEKCKTCRTNIGELWEHEVKTNADRIRAMTDEELAKLLTDVAKKSADKLRESLKTVEVDLSNCNFHILYEAHLNWLKQECKT